MVELGLFADERIELLHGALVEMSPQNEAHANAVEWLTELLVPKLVGRARVRIQLPLALSEDSEPEPDVAVVSLQEARTGHPNSALLVIEVADTTLRKDRRIKADLYAAAHIPEYWIVNLVDKLVTVHTNPLHGQYASISSRAVGENVSPVGFPDVVIEVRQLVEAST
jgi:Uma2 family endonuclease